MINHGKSLCGQSSKSFFSEKYTLNRPTAQTFFRYLILAKNHRKSLCKIASKCAIAVASAITTAVAFENRNICWCIGKDYGLMELIEK